ncbi:MAG: GntR family transcriptional regulator [Bryobacteraceae bacterium]
MAAPTIRIVPDSQDPAYRQILHQIRTLIVEGALAPGAELPSVRRLAVDLGVHFNTVAEAYRLLAEEGFLDVSHGRAARVAERGEAPKPPKQAERRFRERLRHLIAEMRAEGFTPAQIARELNAAAAAWQKGSQ